MSNNAEKRYAFDRKVVIDEASGRTRIFFKAEGNPNDIQSFDVSMEAATSAIYQSTDRFSLDDLAVIQRSLTQSGHDN